MKSLTLIVITKNEASSIKRCRALFRTFVLHLGFLDGCKGFLLAVSNAQGAYYRCVKPWLMGP